MRAITQRAPAKLNLFLHMLAKRPDGYHALESLVVFTSLSDRLTLEPAESLSLTVEGEFAGYAGAGEKNLVLKAARALQLATKCNKGAALRLDKSIPVGAGLGGGSADAAAALRGLNALWELGLGVAELRALAKPLGADVAMCVDPKPALVRGIGDIIEPLTQPLPAMAALLVHPGTPLLTSEVYGNVRAGNFSPPLAPTARLWDWQSIGLCRNDLQAPAIAVSPVVAEVLLVLETMQPAPNLVRMSGSGACCFALYDTLEKAERSANYLHESYNNWWIQPVEVLSGT